MSLCLVDTRAAGEFLDVFSNTCLYIQMGYKTEIPGNCRTETLQLANTIPILPSIEIPVRCSFSAKQGGTSLTSNAIQLLSSAISSSQFWNSIGWQLVACGLEDDVLTVKYTPQRDQAFLHSVKAKVGYLKSLDIGLQYDFEQLQYDHLITVTEVAFRSIIKKLEYQLPLIFTNAIEKIAAPRSVLLESIHEALRGHETHDESTTANSYSDLYTLLLTQASQIGRATLTWRPQGFVVHGKPYKLSFLSRQNKEELS